MPIVRRLPILVVLLVVIVVVVADAAVAAAAAAWAISQAMVEAKHPMFSFYTLNCATISLSHSYTPSLSLTHAHITHTRAHIRIRSECVK